MALLVIFPLILPDTILVRRTDGVIRRRLFARFQWPAYLGRCHRYAFGKHLVGDRQSGAIYEQVIEPGNDAFILAEGL